MGEVVVLVDHVLERGEGVLEIGILVMPKVGLCLELREARLEQVLQIAEDVAVIGGQDSRALLFLLLAGGLDLLDY